MALAPNPFSSDLLLTSREVVLIGEIVRLEEVLRRNFKVGSAAAQETVEICLEQLQGIVGRLSSEDSLVWNFIEDLSEWLRMETLNRTEFGNYSLETLLSEARDLKGSELTEAEVSQFVEFADELDQVRRCLEE